MEYKMPPPMGPAISYTTGAKGGGCPISGGGGVQHPVSESLGTRSTIDSEGLCLSWTASVHHLAQNEKLRATELAGEHCIT